VADPAFALAALLEEVRLAAALFALLGRNWLDYTDTPFALIVIDRRKRPQNEYIVFCKEN
jgi:hypothetical protein